MQAFVGLRSLPHTYTTEIFSILSPVVSQRDIKLSGARGSIQGSIRRDSPLFLIRNLSTAAEGIQGLSLVIVGGPSFVLHTENVRSCDSAYVTMQDYAAKSHFVGGHLQYSDHRPVMKSPGP